MVTQIIGISASQEHFFSSKTSRATRLGPAERKGLSLQVLTRSELVSHLAQNHRVETTWGVHLLDLAGQELHPDYTIADGDRGLRAGQAAWDDVSCHGDVFHAEHDLGKLAFFLENRAAGCTTTRQKLERKINRAKNKGKGRSLSKKLSHVRQAESQAIELAKDIRTLADWMQNDILSLAGPDLQSRRELYDFVVEELHTLESLCPYRITPVLRMLKNNRDNLLAFVGILDERFADISVRFKVPLSY